MPRRLDLPPEMGCYITDPNTGHRVHKRTYDKEGAKMAARAITGRGSRRKEGVVIAYRGACGAWHTGHQWRKSGGDDGLRDLEIALEDAVKRHDHEELTPEQRQQTRGLIDALRTEIARIREEQSYAAAAIV